MITMTGKTRAQVDQDALEAKRKAMLTAADQWLVDTLGAGFPYGGHIWQADERAQSIALATIVLSQSDPTTFPREWRNKDNDMVTFTSMAEFAPFAGAMKGFVDQTYSAVFARKTAIRAAITILELSQLEGEAS